MATMTARLACGLLLCVASGCAETAPARSERDLQSSCEVTGGRWRPSAMREGLCEYQSPGMI